MICPNCATENAAGAKFCNECGTPLAAGCPNCGASNQPGAKFCSECGTQLGGPAQQRAAPGSAPVQADAAPVAERRLVTVLFADLVGFTPFAEERDAEEVRDTLSRYFDLCSEIVARYGGTIEKFIGDAVMAVWGAPTAHEDDAERAVRASLDLVESVAGLAPNAQARAGVLTGHAAVTLGATNQGIVAGDLVNTAARLQSVAQPGTVLVGEATFRAASQAIHFEPAGEQALKGKQSPVPAWRAMRVIAELGGRNRRTEGLEAPFVGRADEFRLLKDLFHATGRERKIRLVSVMGPAGIGKSRLAWEFSKYLDGLVETTYWHSGRSPAYGQGITFWALGEMVRGRAQLVENDDEPTTRQKIADAVRTHARDDKEREWIENALLALLGVATETPSEQLFAAWRTFFERIAEQGTVAMVFEDLHNADTGLLDFIDHMLEWSRGLPIYIITLSRPELLDRRADWGAGKRNFTSIYLEPLADEEMAELLSGLIPGIPESAARAIVARADGIPLYAVETARMLVADGRLEEREGVYVPKGDLTDLAVPETLTALISSRLDALPPADRSLVHDAAVLGQSFTTAALSAVSGISENELEGHLSNLSRRDLIARDTDPFSSERGQFAFVQALIREVAYNTLARKDRKTRHLAAARYFEQLGSDELAGALAEHYLAAYRNAAEGAEADALAAQARIALRAAAERAAGLGAHDQAISFIERALDVTRDDADRAELFERGGDSAKVAARVEQAEKFYRSAIDAYLADGDRLAAARCAVGLGKAYLNVRLLDTGAAWLEQASAEYEDLWPAEPLVEMRVQMGRAYVTLEKPEQALELLEPALTVAEHQNLVPAITEGLITKAAGLGSLGRLRETIALLEGAERLARDNGLSDRLTAALLVGGFYLGEVDVRAVYTKFDEGYGLATRLGQRALAHTFASNLGYTGFLVGDWTRALSVMDEVLDEAVPGTTRIWLLGNIATVRASRGDDVSKLVDEMESYQGADKGDTQVAVLDLKANVYLAQGDYRRARDAWRQVAALQVAQAPSTLYQAARASLWTRDDRGVRQDLADLNATGVHGPIIEIRRATIEAGISALEGRTQEASTQYRDVVRRWHEVGMGWEEALTRLDQILLVGPEIDEATITAARDLLLRIGARPYVELLDQAVGSSTTRAPVQQPPAAAPTVAGAVEVA